MILYLKNYRHHITKDVRYVGKTKGNIQVRFKAHLHEKGNTKKVRWIASLKQQGMLPEVLILEVVDEKKWEEYECYWITYYRELGYDLTNLTDGGDGVHNPSEESRQRLSTVLKEKYANDSEYRAAHLARVRSPEKRAKGSQAQKGKKLSPQHIENLRKREKWTIDEQGKQNMRLAAAKRTEQQIADGTFPLGKREFTEEQRLKISQSSTGRRYPNRRRWTDEEKSQRSLKQKGKPHTAAHSKAIAEGQRRRWERQRQENPGSIESLRKACSDGQKKRLEQMRHEKEKNNDITVYGLWDSLPDDSTI